MLCRLRVWADFHCLCVCCVVLGCAGWVQTEMGNAGAQKAGLEAAPMKLEDSIAKIVALLDTATRESHGGKFWSVDGDKELPW